MNMIARNEITYLLIDDIDLKSIEVEIIARTSGFRWFLSLNEFCFCSKSTRIGAREHIYKSTDSR